MVLFTNMCQRITGIVIGFTASYIGYAGYNSKFGVGHHHNNDFNLSSPISTTTITETLLPTITADVCIPDADGNVECYAQTATVTSFRVIQTSIETGNNEKEIALNHTAERLISLINRVDELMNYQISGVPAHWLVNILWCVVPLAWGWCYGRSSTSPGHRIEGGAVHPMETTPSDSSTKKIKKWQTTRGIRPGRSHLTTSTFRTTRDTSSELHVKVTGKIDHNHNKVKEKTGSSNTEKKVNETHSDRNEIEIALLKKNLATASSNIAQTKLEFNTAQSEIVSLKESLAAAKSTVDHMMNDHTTAQTKIAANEAEMSSMQNRYQQSEHKRQNLEQEKIQLTKTCNSLRSAHQLNQQDREQSKKALTTLSTDNLSLEKELDKMKKETTKLAQEVQEAKHEAKSKDDELKSTSSRMTVMSQQLASMTAEKSMVEASQNNLRTELESSKEKIAELQTSIGKYASSGEVLHKEIAELKAYQENGRVKASGEEASLKASISSLTVQLDSARNEVAALKKDVATKDNNHVASLKVKDDQLTATKQELKSMTNSRQYFEMDLRKADMELEKARKDVTEAEDRQTKLHSEIKLLRYQLQTKSAQVPSTNVAKGRPVPNIDMKELELSKAKMENKEMRERCDGLSGYVTELKAENIKLSKEIASLRNTSKPEGQTASSESASITDAAGKIAPPGLGNTVSETKAVPQTTERAPEEVKITTEPSVVGPVKDESLPKQEVTEHKESLASTPANDGLPKSEGAKQEKPLIAAPADGKRSSESVTANEVPSTTTSTHPNVEKYSKAETSSTTAPDYDWKTDKSLSLDQQIVLVGGRSAEDVLGADYVAKKRQELAATTETKADQAPTTTSLDPEPVPTTVQNAKDITNPSASTTTSPKPSTTIDGAAEMRKSKWADDAGLPPITFSGGLPSSSSSSTTSAKYVVYPPAVGNPSPTDIPTAPRRMRQANASTTSQAENTASPNHSSSSNFGQSPTYANKTSNPHRAPLKQPNYAATIDAVPTMYRFIASTGMYHTKDPEKRRKQYNREQYMKIKQENCANGWHAADTKIPPDMPELAKPRPT